MKDRLMDRIVATIFGVTLTIAGLPAHADGSHGHGHKKQGHGQMKKEGAHGHAKIDYAEVEEHVFGKARDPAHAAKTITIDMKDDLRFSPAKVSVKRGETVRLIVKNRGQLMHELVLGTEESLSEHAALMVKFPGMEHDEPHMAHVQPGKEHEMGWQFTNAGTFHFGCLVPGHYEAGMKGVITVQ